MSSYMLERVQKVIPDLELNMISQGAEALVFLTGKHPYLPSTPSDIQNPSHYIIKYRPPKPYRHEVLDKYLTKSRTCSEAKLLNRLYQLNIPAPKLVALDAPNGVIWMEFIGYHLPNNSISSLKNWLWMLEKEQDGLNHVENIAIGQEVKQVLTFVGIALGKLHLEDIVHGDLTSSNVILVKKTGSEVNEPMLIDFGLSSYSSLQEDKAVDLYVLEKALTSTHPAYSKMYNEWLLEGYEEIHRENVTRNGMKKYTQVIRRLSDVRMRGRKRSMLG